jgi:hypothetical protein
MSLQIANIAMRNDIFTNAVVKDTNQAWLDFAAIGYFGVDMEQCALKVSALN